MTDLKWTEVTLTLGASLITLAAALGAIWLQNLLRNKAAAHEERAKVYQDFLAEVLIFVFQIGHIGEAARLRSGFEEGVAVLFRWRKPIEPFEFFAQMSRNMEPLNRAWSRIWAIGSQDAIDAANDVMDACSEYISAATSRESSSNPITRAFAAASWPPEKEQEAQAALQKVFDARERLALIARREAGQRAAVLATKRQ